MIITVANHPLKLTEETIQKTRQWFADNALGCIEDALSGLVKVNDLPRYVEQQYRRAADSLAGEFDHTRTFAQRALYIETGECVPI